MIEFLNPKNKFTIINDKTHSSFAEANNSYFME